MFCKQCGKELKGRYCIYCGFQEGNGAGHCHHCGSEMAIGADFCIKCGKLAKAIARSKIENTCTKCYAVIPNASSFCPKCGDKVENQMVFCQYCGQEANQNSDVCLNCGNLLFKPANVVDRKVNSISVNVENEVINKLKFYGRLSALVGSILLIISAIAKIIAAKVSSDIATSIYNGDFDNIEELLEYNKSYKVLVNILDNVSFRIIFVFGLLLLVGSIILFTLTYKNKNKIINYIRYSVIPSSIGITLLLILLATFIGNQVILTMLLIFSILSILVVLGDVIFRFITQNRNIYRLVTISTSAIAIFIVLILYITYIKSCLKTYEITASNLSLYDITLEYSSFDFALYGQNIDFISSMDYLFKEYTKEYIKIYEQNYAKVYQAFTIMRYYIYGIVVTIISVLSRLLFNSKKQN